MNIKKQQRTNDGSLLWIVHMNNGDKFLACGLREEIRRIYNNSAPEDIKVNRIVRATHNR